MSTLQPIKPVNPDPFTIAPTVPNLGMPAGKPVGALLATPTVSPTPAINTPVAPVPPVTNSPQTVNKPVDDKLKTNTVTLSTQTQTANIPVDDLSQTDKESEKNHVATSLKNDPLLNKPVDNNKSVTPKIKASAMAGCKISSKLISMSTEQRKEMIAKRVKAFEVNSAVKVLLNFLNENLELKGFILTAKKAKQTNEFIYDSFAIFGITVSKPVLSKVIQIIIKEKNHQVLAK